MSSPRGDLEQLRQNAERLADQLPRASTKDEALEIARNAAETSLRALALVNDPTEKARCRTRAEQLLREAERIKHSNDWRRAINSTSSPLNDQTIDTSKVRILQEPVSTRELSRREQIILLKAGFLNGVKFPPWTGEPSPTEFDLKDGEDLFLDEASELPLSDFQLDVLDDWKRPRDALPPPSWFPGDRENLGPTMGFYRNIDLVQDAATDCSVVASLCAGVARGKRGHPRMMQKFLFPFDRNSGTPLLSKNGKYVVRMNFNGCQRKVVIDDRIPTSTTNRVIHVVDRNNPGLLWPALVEKAYLKIRGGYDFPGSNSGTDLWILTGWIPEQVFLQADDMELDRFWKRISNGFAYGDVLITMGTGKMSSKTERALGLAGEHDYAVLDLREVDGQRLVLIKNPWVEGQAWRGRFKNQHRRTDRQSSRSPEGTFGEAEAVDSPRDLLNDDELTPGTFWMDIDNVLQHFESIYLNWNTGLFKFRQDIHFGWDLSEPLDENGLNKTRGPYASLQHNPQFNISASRGGDVWVLLWRHFQNSVPENATDDEIESGRHYIDLNGYIAMVVFASNGRRAMLSERYLQKLWLVDSPQTLLKLENCEPGKVYTVAALEQDLPATNHTFTLCAFSNSPLQVNEALPRFSHVTQVKGSWTAQSAGGNGQHCSYCNNPQYSINVPYKTSISLLVEAYDPKLNVHVRLLHSRGERLWRVRNQDIIVDSRNYRPGCCFADFEDLEPGRYTVVCSTFEPQQLGDFTLRIDSSQPITATLLPKEGAGRIRHQLSHVAFKAGESKVAAPLAPRRMINFYAIARPYDQDPSATARRSSHSHVRLSIELGRGPSRKILMASNGGEYSDSIGTVRTDPIDLGPDFTKFGFRDCFLVLDRMYVSSEGQEERFMVELFVDQPDAMQVGVWRAWED